jgi:tetratricopeptide (TPR) repeat protein
MHQATWLPAIIAAIAIVGCGDGQLREPGGTAPAGPAEVQAAGGSGNREAARVPDAAAQAERAYADGSRLVQEGRLDEAMVALRLALDIAPAHREAGNLLAQTILRCGRADQLFNHAQDLAREEKFDDAIEAVEAALTAYPRHAGARLLDADLRRSAAASCVEAAQAAGARGERAEAERQFRQALRYDPNQPGARDGLARADFFRGQGEERRGLLGSALVWYVGAAERSANPEHARAADAVRAMICRRLAFSLGVEEGEADIALPPGLTADLRGRILKELAARGGELVEVVDGPRAGGPPTYTATLRLVQLSIRAQPHTADSHRETASLAVRIDVSRSAGGEVVRSDTSRANVRFEDAAVRSPDSKVLAALAAAAAPDAAARILDGAMAHRESEIRAAGDRLRREGRPAEALEADVYLAIFLQGRDPNESARLLQTLRAQRKQGDR